MTKRNYTFYFKNEINSVRKLKNLIVQLKEDHGVKTSILKHIRLSLEELIVNIISYGYADHKEHTIELKVNCLKDHFSFYLNSGGIPFNPLTYKSRKDRTAGGFGILLAKTFMDKMSYQYKNGCNCITLIKKRG